MKTDSNNNTHNKWLSEDRIADNIGIPSSYSISNLSLNQIANLLITSVLSEIELDNKNFNISNIESLQLKIQSIITAIINNQFIIYEKLIQKAEKDLRYYISKEFNHRVQEESNKVYIQHLLNQLEEYEKIKKQFDFIVSTDMTVETEDTINEINQLKEENTRLKLKIKELEIKTKDSSNQYHYILNNENFSPNFSLLNHHQRISSISSNSNNQSPLITDFTNSAGNKTSAKKNSIRNLYYQPHPILDSLISPKSSFKYNNSNNKNGNYEPPKNRCALHKNGIQYTQINTNINSPGTDEINKHGHHHNHSNKFHSNKKENCLVNEFLSILKNNKSNNKNNTQNNSNNNHSANVNKTNKHKKSSSQYKLNSKADKQFNNNEKQLIKNYYNNFVMYRNNNNLLNQKSKYLSYQKGVIPGNNSNNNLIKILTSTNYNKTITVNSKSTNITKQPKPNTLKKSSPINMGLIYSSNLKKHKQQYES